MNKRWQNNTFTYPSFAVIISEALFGIPWPTYSMSTVGVHSITLGEVIPQTNPTKTDHMKYNGHTKKSKSTEENYSGLTFI